MIYRDFKGTKLSMLGFGTMRLPVLENGQIDAALTQKMVDYAMAHGVNYYDTAWPYMQNRSETVVGQCLKKHPRDSFYLATKFPGHMVAETYDPADIFEQQLQKCQVEYFDFYLLHNVYENSVHVYDDPRWGIVDYFVEQKKRGRIKHLGFSSHADLPCLTDFLNRYGDEMEFCQLQFNYLDWTLQHGKEKYELLRQRNIPLWVMEPVRGGKLVTLEPDEEQRLHAIRPDDSIASFGFRWLQGFDNIAMVLSGMSSMEQMRDNLSFMADFRPLNDTELAAIARVQAIFRGKHLIPCTSCRYCTDGCPKHITIPDLFATMNTRQLYRDWNAGYYYDIHTMDGRKASDCVKCGKCEHVCPQHLPIRKLLEDVAKEFETKE